jgi:hypothetical protein
MPATVEERRKQIRRIQTQQRSADADVGDLIDEARKLINVERRAACERDLYLYLQTYFPFSTGLSAFSDDHRRVIAHLQDSFFTGGRFVEAVYRGFAKTTISQNTVLWAESYGHRRCLPLFGATDSDATRNMQSIKLELETNELLCEDFPEICIPVRALQGRPQRCASQTYHDEPTHIDWTADQIVLPTIKGSVASGGIVVCRGLTGATRGLVFKRPDGSNQRPDGILIDDPQTDESAVSPAQVEKRLDIIRRSILRSGGHRQSLACVVTCTVRAVNDLAEQLLDYQRNPSWQGERIRMVRRWADEHGAEAGVIVPQTLGPLWGKYAEIRNTFDRELPGDQKRAWKEATAFYAANRAAMDAGCIVSWESCFDPEHELSSIQHAYNILIDDGPDVFSTECQNVAVDKSLAGSGLTPELIQSQLNGKPKGVIPDGCILLTHCTDVGKLKGFHWLVRAWEPNGTSHVIDKGIMSVQGAKFKSDEGLERAIVNSVLRRMEEFRSARYAFANGEVLDKTISTFDARWQTDAVLSGVSKAGLDVFGIMGIGKSAGAVTGVFRDVVTNTAQRRKCGTTGAYEELHVGPYGKRWVVHASADKWKTFEHERWLTAQDMPGCAFLWGVRGDGTRKSADEMVHQDYAKHICAEREVQDGQDRKWIETGAENDYLDASWHSCCAAAMRGVRVLGVAPPARPPTPKTKVNISGRDGGSFFITNR